MSAATAAARQPKAYYPSASKPHTLPSKPLTTERHPVLRASTLVHGSTPGTGSTAAGALTLGTGGKLQPTAGSGSGGLLVPTTMAQAYHLSLAAALATGQNHHTSTTFSLASIPQQPPLSAAFPPKLAASFGSASFAMPASSSRLSQTADPGSNFTFPASPRSLTSTAVPGSRHDSNSPPGSSYLTAAQHRGFHPTATELGLSSERSEAMSSVPPVAKTKFMHQSNKHGPLTVLRPQDLFPKIVAESNDPRPITATVIRHPPAEPSSSNGLPAPQDGLQPFPIDSISVHVAPKPATPPVPVRTPMYARRGTPNLPIPVSYDPHPPPLLHEPSSSCSGAPEIAEGAAGGAMAAAEATTADAATAEAGSGDQTGCDVSFDDDVAQLPIDVAPPPAHSGGPKGESLLPPNVVLHLVEMTDVKSPSADPHAAAASSHSAAVQSQEPASGSPAGDQSQSKSVSTSVSSDVGMSSREHSFVDVGPTHGVGTTTRVESAFRSGSIDSVLEALISALPERTATPAPKQGTFSCTTAPAAASILDTLHTRNDAAAGAGTAAAAAVQLSIHPSILNSGTARSDLGAAGAAQPEPSTPLVVLADSRPSTLAGLLAEGLQVMSRPPTRPGRNPSEGLVGTASPAVTNSRPGTRAGVNTADAAVAPADLAETGSSPPHEFELHTQVLDSGDKQALDMLQEIAGSGSSSEVDGCLSSADEGGDEDVQSLNLSSPEDSDTEVDMNSGQAASSSRTTSKTLHHTSASHAIQLDDDTNTAAGIDASLANDTNAGLANDTDASLANDMVEAGVRVLGQKYEVQQLVGEGAYGMVTKCRVRGTDHYVAIKEFKIEDDDPDAEDVKRTSKREVDLLRCLKHPNVVGLVDEFYVRDHLFIVMEYVPCNLLELLEAQPGGMDRDAIRLIMFQLCTAMSFIHSQNIIFRDIKPENVLVDERGRLKLCDFGFARSMANMGSNRRLTDYVATRWYRAPELLLGPPYHASNAPDAAYVQSMYGQAVDMWAIGCVLGELSDGEPLFAGDSDLDQLYKVQQMLGPMSAEQQGLFNGNPHNTGIVFNIKKASTLGSRYQDKMSDLELDFMEGMLRMDPTQRLTAEQCLAHPYLANLVAADDKSRGENSASASSAVAALQVPVSLLPPPSRVGSSAASSGRFSALPPGLPTGTGHSDNGTGRITHSRRTSFTSEGKRASLGFESGEMSPMPRLGERTEGCPDWANQTVGPVKGRLSLEMTLLAPCPEDDALNLQAEDSASANAAVASQPVVEGSASAAPVAAMEAVSAVASQPVADGSASAAQTVPQPAMVDAAESATQPNADAASAPSPPPGGAGSSDAAAEPAEAATQPVISHSVADSAEAQRVSVSQIADPAAEPVVSLPTGGDAEVSPAQ